MLKKYSIANKDSNCSRVEEEKHMDQRWHAKFLNRLKQITLSLKKATHNNGTYASTLTQTKS